MEQLIHAQKCQGSARCTMRAKCAQMKRVLQHMPFCTRKGTCPRKFCISSRELICHWKKCRRCRICRQVSERVNSGRSTPLREATEERETSAEEHQASRNEPPGQAVQGARRSAENEVGAPDESLAAQRPPLGQQNDQRPQQANGLRAAGTGNNVTTERVSQPRVRQQSAPSVVPGSQGGGRTAHGGTRVGAPMGSGAVHLSNVGQAIPLQRQGLQTGPRPLGNGHPLTTQRPMVNLGQPIIHGSPIVRGFPGSQQGPGVILGRPMGYGQGLNQPQRATLGHPRCQPQMGPFGPGHGPQQPFNRPNYGQHFMQQSMMNQGMPGNRMGPVYQIQVPMQYPNPASHHPRVHGPPPHQPSFQPNQPIPFGARQNQIPANTSSFPHPVMPFPNRRQF